MTLSTNPQEKPKSLYDQDFQLWIEQTIHQLQNRDFETLDTENLIEELMDLGNSNRVALESNLAVLLAHLLKLNVQHDAPETMKGSDSKNAKFGVPISSESEYPTDCPFSTEQILDDDFYRI